MSFEVVRTKKTIRYKRVSADMVERDFTVLQLPDQIVDPVSIPGRE